MFDNTNGQNINQLTSALSLPAGRSIGQSPLTGEPQLTDISTLAYLGVSQGAGLIAQPNSIARVFIPEWARPTALAGVSLVNAGLLPPGSFTSPHFAGDILPFPTYAPSATYFLGVPLIGTIKSDGPDADGYVEAVLSAMCILPFNLPLPPPDSAMIRATVKGSAPLGDEIPLISNIPILAAPYRGLISEGITIAGTAGEVVQLKIDGNVVLTEVIPPSGFLQWPLALSLTAQLVTLLSTGTALTWLVGYTSIPAGPTPNTVILIQGFGDSAFKSWLPTTSPGVPSVNLYRNLSGRWSAFVYNADSIDHTFHWRYNTAAPAINWESLPLTGIVPAGTWAEVTLPFDPTGSGLAPMSGGITGITVQARILENIVDNPPLLVSSVWSFAAPSF